MEDYISKHTGAQIDDGISRILNGPFTSYANAKTSAPINITFVQDDTYQDLGGTYELIKSGDDWSIDSGGVLTHLAEECTYLAIFSALVELTNENVERTITLGTFLNGSLYSETELVFIKKDSPKFYNRVMIKEDLPKNATIQTKIKINDITNVGAIVDRASLVFWGASPDSIITDELAQAIADETARAIAAEEDLQTTQDATIHSYKTFLDEGTDNSFMPLEGKIGSIYEVTDDPDTTLQNPPLSNNARYSWNGSEFVRERDLDKGIYKAKADIDFNNNKGINSVNDYNSAKTIINTEGAELISARKSIFKSSLDTSILQSAAILSVKESGNYGSIINEDGTFKELYFHSIGNQPSQNVIIIEEKYNGSSYRVVSFYESTGGVKTGVELVTIPASGVYGIELIIGVNWDIIANTSILTLTGTDKLPIKLNSNNITFDKQLKIYNTVIYVAAYDSEESVKKTADFVASNLTDGITKINAALNALPSVGGKIYLYAGNYGGAGGVDIKKDNVIIEGEGYTTYIQRDGIANDIYINPAKERCLLKNVRCKSRILFYGENHVENCWVGTEYYGSARSSTIVVAAFNSAQRLKTMADIVATSNSDGIPAINRAIALLPAAGGTVKLMPGTYYGSVGIELRSHLHLCGEGWATKIQRDSGNDWYATSTSPIIGALVEKIQYTNKAITNYNDVRIINCYENNKYINEDRLNTRVIHVGKSITTQGIDYVRYDYEKLSNALNSISDSYSTKVRFEIYVHGYIEETGGIDIDKKNTDIFGVGKATVVMNNNTTALLANIQVGFEGVIKDIEFISEGTSSDVANSATMMIFSPSATLINVIARNNHISTSDPLTPDDYSVAAGNRLHGIMVKNSAKLINCKGYGSENGNHDTRGIYIESGPTNSITPKLINCEGYGGGKKDISGKPANRCHGIIVHTGASGILDGCKGYAGGDDEGTQSSGIKFQSACNPVLNNCIGYGNSADGGGIYVGYITSPTLNNCIGYAGKNDGAAGLRVDHDAFPKILGGYFGAKEINWDFYYTNENNGRFKIDSKACYIKSIQLWVQVAYAGETIDIGTTIGGTEIATGISIGTVGWVIFDFSKTEITEGNYIYITPSVAISDNDLRFNLIAINNNAIKSCVLDTAGGVKITNTLFSTPPAGDGIKLTSKMNSNSDFYIDKAVIDCEDINKNAIDCDSAFTLLPITNSKIKGVVNGVTSFFNTLISGSTNYR